MNKQNNTKKFRPYYVRKKLEDGSIFRGFRLKALKTFTLANGETVRKGQLSGLVSSYKALSHTGNWWINRTSMLIDGNVSENAYVEDSIIRGSVISGNAYVKGSHVSGVYNVVEGTVVDSVIEDSKICKNVQVINNSIVKNATIGEDNAAESEHVTITSSTVEGATIVGNTAVISSLVETSERIENTLVNNVAIKGKIGTSYAEEEIAKNWETLAIEHQAF